MCKASVRLTSLAFGLLDAYCADQASLDQIEFEIPAASHAPATTPNSCQPGQALETKLSGGGEV